MLKRWNVKVYNIDFLIAILDYVLTFIDLDLKFKRKKPKRSAKLYIKALILKEILKISLRYAESYSLIYLHIRIPKSTLNYWEIKHGDIIEKVLITIFSILLFIDYDYSIMDSTKFNDWRKELHELFISIRVKNKEALFPIHSKITNSEVEFVKDIPEGSGFMFADGAFDAKPVLNTIVSKGYLPIIKKGVTNPRGFGARIRDKIYDESLYVYRNVGEGIFGALTVEFGDRIKTKRKESFKTRVILRIIVYCLKIIIRCIYE